MNKRHAGLCLCLSVVISVSAQLAFITLSDAIRTPEYFFADMTSYLSVSGNICFRGEYSLGGFGIGERMTERPTRIRQPGYPLFLCVFYWMAGPSMLILQLSQVALNVATIIILYAISRTIFGVRLWGGTIVLIGLYFPLWIMSAFVMSEILFAFFLALSMLLLLKALRSRAPLDYVYAGIAFGASFLTRPVVLPLLVFSAAPLWLCERKLRGALARFGAMALAFCLCISPWFLRNALVFGDYTPLSTAGGYNLWCSTEEAARSPRKPGTESAAILEIGMGKREDSKRFTDLAVRNIKADPLGHLGRGLARVGSRWTSFPGIRAYSDWPVLFGLFTCVQILLLLFAALGLLGLDGWRAAYLLLPAACATAALLVSWGPPRHLLPFMPYVVCLAGQGIYLVKRSLFRTRVPR